MMSEASETSSESDGFINLSDYDDDDENGMFDAATTRPIDNDEDVEPSDEFSHMNDCLRSMGLLYIDDYDALHVQTTSTGSVDEVENEMAVQHLPTAPSDFCQCSHCCIMPSPKENLCCMTNFERQSCLTHTEDFGHLMAPAVLKVELQRYRVENYPTDLDTPLNRYYRFLAYRLLCSHLYGWLGKKNRRVLPACAVKRIRELYPLEDENEQFTGFHEP